MNTPILTATLGTNSDLLPKVFELYVPDGSIIADITYGRGVFWKNIDKNKYTLLESDIAINGVDFRRLPYDSDSFDVVIFDPPYMHGGKTVVKKTLNDPYRNHEAPVDSHEGVIRQYASGILEISRVLKKKGIAIIKCQDEIESGVQHLSHVEIIQLLDLLGFQVLDIFILVQNNIPTMREDYQKSARKNHSYLIIAKFRR